MINIKEIRIGNYFNYGKDELEIIQVTSIMVSKSEDKIDCPDGVNIQVATSRDIYPRYQTGLLFGIPLTPEILEKCGFVEDKYNPGRFEKEIDDQHKLVYGSYDGIILECDDTFYNIELSKIQYVHQLQNLYFALTGNELNINL